MDPEVSAAVAAARAERARTGAPPVNPDHRCTVDCVTVGSRRVRVCIASLAVHVCPGASCRFLRVTSEGSVCGLSGFEVASASENVVTVYTRETGTTSISTRHWGNVDRGTQISSKRAAPKESDQLTRCAIESYVKLFLSSRMRHEIYTVEFGKVKEQCTKLAKATREPVTLDNAIKSVVEIYRDRASLCRRPAPDGVQWLSTLASAIFNFWRGIRDHLPMKKKNAPAFVATVLSLMGEDGLTLGGVCFIPKSSLVRRHCPRPRQFSGFRGRMTCRRITQYTRALKTALTLPSGAPRIVPPLVFTG